MPADSATPATSLGDAADSITATLQQLTGAQVLKLLGDIERPWSALDQILIENLMRTAVADVAHGNIAHALQALSQVVTLDPEHGHQLIHAEASLAPIRIEVANLLERLSFESKSKAEQILASASLRSGEAGARAHDPDAQIVLALAGRLIESGQPANFVRAGELAQAVLAYYGASVPDAIPINFADKRDSHAGKALPTGRLIQWLKMVWRRAPVLILLVAWLFLGIVCGLVARITQRPLSDSLWEIWALGFPALVGFQFFVRVRNTRF